MEKSNRNEAYKHSYRLHCSILMISTLKQFGEMKNPKNFYELLSIFTYK